MKAKISPSMMCADIMKMEPVLEVFEKTGMEYLHINIMDGQFVPDTEGAAEMAAKWLYQEAHPQYVILKIGGRGALLYDVETTQIIPCFQVDAVDSTAAGDTFGAALAIRLCEGADMLTAIRFAHAAAGICVSRAGAQTSIPGRDEVEAFLEEHDAPVLKELEGL